MQKKIMVPLGPQIHDLKSVHYALAAAERLQAAIIILRLADDHRERPPWFEQALADLVASARLAGLKLTIIEAEGDPECEVVALADTERIDLLVFGEGQGVLEHDVLQLDPRLGHLIIQVREKDTMDLGTREGGPRWPS